MSAGTGSSGPPRKGPPPLRPFGLRLHHDGSWSHEGVPLAHRKLRERFDRSVRFLPDEAKYVVQIGHFRGEIELEEAGFFVRAFDERNGEILLSDDSTETLDVSTLRTSPIEGALLCTVKVDLVPGGLLARFHHNAHSALMNAIDEDGESLRIGEERVALPELAE